MDILPDAWLKTVSLVGVASREGLLDVEAMLVHGAEPEGPYPGEAPFWEPSRLEDLAESQEVAPVADLEEMTALWPEDEMLDDALGDLLQDRAERRQSGRTKAV